MGLAWFFRRRKKAVPVSDPAEELKRKLEETRGAEPEPTPEAEPEPTPEAEPEPAPERPLDERRDEVHRRARESIDRMRGDE